MFGLGTQELLIILVIAFFIFGGKKLPEIGAGLGKGLRSFKQGLKEIDLEKEEKGKRIRRAQKSSHHLKARHLPRHKDPLLSRRSCRPWSSLPGSAPVLGP